MNEPRNNASDPAAGPSPTKSLPDPNPPPNIVAVPQASSAAAFRYVLGAEIARGGMGIVYRATDTALGREVAVKVLHEKYASGSDAARRFFAEAKITSRLQHPAIPPVHDLGTLPDGRPFMAMKLIQGRTLTEELAARSDPSHDRGRFIAAFAQVCQAVAYAHAHGVIHRDLKPLWDAKTGAEVLTLKGHTESVVSASFSVDCTRILTASADGTVKIWDSRPFRESRPAVVELAPPPKAIKP